MSTQSLSRTGGGFAAAGHEESPEGRAYHCPRTKRILVVDDCWEIRECIAKLVSREGFGAETAQDGEEAWRAICAREFDLIITDHQMPRMTGLDLIRRVRGASIEAPCILISTELPEAEPALLPLIRPGAALKKPFRFDALIKVVSSLLDQGELESIPEA